MDYKGEWGGGGPGHSWALKWHERSNIGSKNKPRQEQKPFERSGIELFYLFLKPYCESETQTTTTTKFGGLQASPVGGGGGGFGKK
jgi:hypothetical protein